MRNTILVNFKYIIIKSSSIFLWDRDTSNRI
nr:MAG TPA: hypothetical protein [Caudoviricetes sp.]